MISKTKNQKKHCFYKEKWREGPPHSNNTHLFFGNVAKTLVLAIFVRGLEAAFGDERSKDLYPPEPLQETCLGNKLCYANKWNAAIFSRKEFC